MTKVRHLTTVHVISDTRVFHKEVGSLHADGFDVALIACHPRDEQVDGVPVLGLGKPSNRFDRMTRMAWRCYRRAWREQADIYHFHDPELIPVGLLLAARGRTVVYDVHEDVPRQIMNKFWIWPPLKRLFAAAADAFETLAGRCLAAIVVANPNRASKFPAEKTVVVQNFPEAALVSQGRDIPFPERRNAFVYIGGLSEQQGLFTMIDAAALLRPGLTGVLGGNFKQFRERAEARPGWDRVRYGGVLDRVQVEAEIRDSVCGLALFHPISNYLEAYSTKMFEYMACGVPVVSSDIPLWRGVVEAANCGVVVDPYDPAAAAAAIQRFNDDLAWAAELGENGRRAVTERFNWQVEYAKMRALYERLAPRA